MSEDPGYRAAVRRGEGSPHPEGGPELRDPEGIELELQPTLAGSVPLIVARERADFETLVRAFVGRNEPIEVPTSQGACLVKGLVNWDRVARHKRQWKQRRGPFATDAAWKEEMQRLAGEKHLYQDRILLLSTGPYSGIAAGSMDRAPGRWREDSLTLRREHECFHYVTLRLYDLIRNHLLDEILADLAGLVVVEGSYDPDLALRFLGLERPAAIRSGARLEIYREELANGALEVVVRMAVAAVDRLGDLVAGRAELTESRERTLFLLALASLGLEGILSEEAEERLAGALESLSSRHSGLGWRRHFRTDEEILAGCLQDFQTWTREQLLPESMRRRGGVILDEILTNVANHAYPEDRTGWVAVELSPRGDGSWELTVVDEGPPFDPLSQPAPETSESLEEATPGGVGLHLVRQMSRSARYERVANRNRLQLVL